MNKIEDKLIGQIEGFIELLNQVTEVKSGEFDFEQDLLYEFKTGIKSFTSKVYGMEHTYYKTLRALVNDIYPQDLKRIKGVLNAMKKEIESGFLNDIKGLVSADIFSDFLEMAEHLIEENYEDPAAVIIGSVLEEHLRQLCFKSNIELTVERRGKFVPEKASVLNIELTKKHVLNKLDNKNVNAWLGLRNDAAHGNYDEYNKDQVEQLLVGVQSFITRYPI